MERQPDSKIGTTGWMAIGAFVVAFDVLAPESLSHSFERGRDHQNPLIRAATLGGLAITTLHLLDLWPRQIDPFYKFIDWKNNANT